MQTKKESYSIFRVAESFFAVRSINVIEVMTARQITHVPKGPNYMTGLFNHRGRILSLINTSVRLNLPSIEIQKNPLLMVLRFSDGTKELDFGIILEEVIEVLEIEETKIQVYPSTESPFDITFIEGIFNYLDNPVTILDIKKTFNIK